MLCRHWGATEGVRAGRACGRAGFRGHCSAGLVWGEGQGPRRGKLKRGLQVRVCPKERTGTAPKIGS